LSSNSDKCSLTSEHLETLKLKKTLKEVVLPM